MPSTHARHHAKILIFDGRLPVCTVVLQHDQPIVGGRCKPGTKITATVTGARTTETANGGCDALGYFTVMLQPRPPAAAEFVISVSASQTPGEENGGGVAVAPPPPVPVTEAMRVRYGSVFICGGQSNMVSKRSISTLPVRTLAKADGTSNDWCRTVRRASA